MANTILLKRSATQSKVPTTSQLELGEIAINTYDGKLFIKKNDGSASIVEIGAVTSVNSATGAVVLDTDDISEGSSNTYFTNARARSALSAGTGVTYNSSTGAISIGQSVATTASPTFAGMTLTGDVAITGSIIPTADNTYSLGSANFTFKDVFVGPGSLYVNGKEVVSDQSGTITVSTDTDQNLQFKTSGQGDIQLVTGAQGTITVSGALQIASGYNITDSAGSEVNFGDQIDMNGNKIFNLGAPSSANDAATKTYVDTQVSAISTSSISQGNSNVTVTDSGTGTVTVSVDGSTALTVTSTGVTVAGNFTVSGSTTTVESNTVSVADNIITLNSDATGSASQNAGIEVERGDDANVSLRWNEGSDIWQFTNDGATYYPMAKNTTDLAEGTNQYFTTARARSSISAGGDLSYNSTTGTVSFTERTDAEVRGLVSVTDAGGDGSLTYNSTTGVITYTGPSASEVRAHFAAGTGISISSGTISTSAIPNASLTNSSITINSNSVSLGGSVTLDTDDVSEGASNLYFTTQRARDSFSAGTNISISNGVISANDTSVNWSEVQNKPDPVITLAGDLSGSVTLTDLASGTLTATIVANSVALGTDTTGNYVATVSAGTGISVSGSGTEGAGVTVTNTGVTSLNGDTGAKTLAHFHSSVQTVTSTQETSNASSSVAYTFSELSAAVHYIVFINRTMLRPSEYTVSGTSVTFASGFGLQEGDELEVTGARFTA
jgi:hypothetical protein